MARHLSILMLLFLGFLAARGQGMGASINHDAKTIAEMNLIYGEQLLLEQQYSDAVDRILSSYGKSLVESTMIFMEKKMEHDAMSSLKRWGREVTAYKHIYYLVSHCILPKTLSVASLMMRYPDNALYWIGYLLRITNDTKQWCMTFQNIVVDSKFSFRDVGLLELDPEVMQAYLDAIRQVELIDKCINLCKNPDAFKAASRDFVFSSSDNVTSLVEQAMKSVTSLNVTSLKSDVANKTATLGGAKELLTAVKQLYKVYKTVRTEFSGAFKQMMAGVDVRNPEVVKKLLFRAVAYDEAMRSMEQRDQYPNQRKEYTQQWYIAYSDTAKWNQLYEWKPTQRTADPSDPLWLKLPASKNPTDGEYAAMRGKFDQYALYRGCEWNRAKVEEANRNGRTMKFEYVPTKAFERTEGMENTGYNPSGTSSSGTSTQQGGLSGQKDFSGTTIYAYWADGCKVYEAAAKVVKVYEETYNSYDMDFSTFEALMRQRLAEQEEKDPSHNYYIGYEEKRYYDLPNDEKVGASEICQIFATCQGGSNLMDGQSGYKCNDCYKKSNTPLPACHDHAMMTNAPTQDPEFGRVRDHIPELERKIELKKQAIAMLEQKLASSTGDTSGLAMTIKSEKKKLAELQQELTEYKKAYNEMLAEGDGNVGNESERLPFIMRYLENEWGVSWTDQGGWEGDSFIRHGTSTSTGKDTLTFTAKLIVARPVVRFPIVGRVHRAKMTIKYGLAAKWTESSLVETLNRAKDVTDEQWAKEVRDAVARNHSDFPECDISSKLLGNERPEEGEPVKHLLWSSERFEVARNVETQLVRIYCQLVSLEKFLHYKHNIVDVLLREMPRPEVDSVRRASIYSECLDKWKLNGRPRQEGFLNGFNAPRKSNAKIK